MSSITCTNLYITLFILKEPDLIQSFFLFFFLILFKVIAIQYHSCTLIPYRSKENIKMCQNVTQSGKTRPMLQDAKFSLLPKLKLQVSPFQKLELVKWCLYLWCLYDIDIQSYDEMMWISQDILCGNIGTISLFKPFPKMYFFLQ